MATRNQRRVERRKLITEFDARWFDDPDVRDLPVIRKLRKRYHRLVEECQAEESPSRQSLVWKAVFVDCHLDTSVINALTKAQKLDIGVLAQELNCLIGLYRSLFFGKNVTKGTKLHGKSVRLADHLSKRKSA